MGTWVLRYLAVTTSPTSPGGARAGARTTAAVAAARRPAVDDAGRARRGRAPVRRPGGRAGADSGSARTRRSPSGSGPCWSRTAAGQRAVGPVRVHRRRGGGGGSRGGRAELRRPPATRTSTARSAEWARAFGAEILVPADDAAWLRADPDAAGADSGPGTASRAAGVDAGPVRRALPGQRRACTGPTGRTGAASCSAGDTIFVTPGEDRVTFVWSAPNRLPLSEAAVRGVCRRPSGLIRSTGSTAAGGPRRCGPGRGRRFGGPGCGASVTPSRAPLSRCSGGLRCILGPLHLGALRKGFRAAGIQGRCV